MLTKINIISCETCGRIVTRSRIDGFPSSLADAVISLARGRHDWRPALPGHVTAPTVSNPFVVEDWSVPGILRHAARPSFAALAALLQARITSTRERIEVARVRKSRGTAAPVKKGPLRLGRLCLHPLAACAVFCAFR